MHLLHKLEQRTSGIRIIKVCLRNKKGGKQNSSSEHVVKGKETAISKCVLYIILARLLLISLQHSTKVTHSMKKNRCSPQRHELHGGKNTVGHLKKPVTELLAQPLFSVVWSCRQSAEGTDGTESGGRKARRQQGMLEGGERRWAEGWRRKEARRLKEMGGKIYRGRRGGSCRSKKYLKNDVNA